MDSYRNLTVNDDNENTPSKEDLELQLEENYYEKLFIEEMNFRNKPTKSIAKRIIQKHCQAVEYFSSIEDNKRASKYKLLNNIFLNDPQVIQILDKKEISDLKNNMIKKILISNQKENQDKYKKSNEFDEIKPKKFCFDFNDEKEKLEELIKKKNIFENKKESINLINDEITEQKNNFKKNLSLKLQKKKSLNENKILQGIQNVFIKVKSSEKKYNNDDEENEMINSEIKENIMNNVEKKISPIKPEKNYSEKETASTNELKYDSNNNNYISPLLSSANNKKNTSEFVPLTPLNEEKSDKTNEFKSSEKQDISIISEEVNETNDFELINNENNFNNNGSQENLNKKETIINQGEISSNETKYTNNSNNNSRTLSNYSINNSPKLLNESNITSSNLLKSFRLDFNDLFEYIKEKHSYNKKTTSFCNDIKIIIENYINDFNQHLSKNLLEKIIKKFSDIWEEMFKKYSDISDFFEKEIKQLDDDNNKNKSNIAELSNLIDNINLEKENAFAQNEEKFLNEIKNNEIYFKENYDKFDNGILLLNEKFAYTITERVYDMINNI